MRDVQDRHAAYFLALAKPAETELHGAGQLAWLNRLETRRDNLSAALSWLVARDQPGMALDLVWATWRFWWLHGHAGNWPATWTRSWRTATACHRTSAPWP